jgi:outer membrane protein assembly factor BamB
MDSQRRWLAIGLSAVAACVIIGAYSERHKPDDGTRQRVVAGDERDGGGDAAAPNEADSNGSDSTDEASTSAPVVTDLEPFVGREGVLSDPDGFQKAYPGASVQGLLTFRGNPTRSFHGTGPVPRAQPEVLWKAPGTAMCGKSSEYNQTRTWCGTGWTGQPAVFERDGRTWVVFGAFDYKFHFLDAATGEDIIPPFKTKDIAKGNVTIDPNGYPLLYAGSRDNKFRIIAFDGTEPRELYAVDAQTADRKWNNDWDAAAIVIGDYLLEGSENSWFYGWKLNRGYADDGSVTVDPQLVFRVRGWDSELLSKLPDNRVSLETSVMVLGNIAYLNSSGGLLQGWDLSKPLTGGGQPKRVFRFWTGDDSDATVVGDPEGMLYVGAEVDRVTRQGSRVGQLLKIDPNNTDDPVVWSVRTPGRDNGTWSTPAIYGDTVIWATKPGYIYGLDRATGEERWKIKVSGPMLSSPAVVDGVLMQGDGAGVLHAWELGDGLSHPSELWQVDLGSNIESTPAVWKGRIYVGARNGFMFSIGVPG